MEQAETLPRWAFRATGGTSERPPEILSMPQTDVVSIQYAFAECAGFGCGIGGMPAACPDSSFATRREVPLSGSDGNDADSAAFRFEFRRFWQCTPFV